MHDCIYNDTSGGGILAQCTTVYTMIPVVVGYLHNARLYIL